MSDGTPIDELVHAARGAWPGVEVARDVFAAWLEARMGNEGHPERAVELYLTCACARGDATAVARFQQAFFGEIDSAARRARAGATVAADARQNLARSLFTGAAPAIATFRGRGDLRGWMRVAAMREVLRLAKSAKRDVLVEDERLLDAVCPASDPEVGYLREHFRDEITGAFARAVAGISEEHRGLLRRQLEGVTVDELAAELGIHRGTASRRLAAARQAVLERTRRELGATLGAVSADVESMIRLVGGRLDVSLGRLLGG